MRLQCPGCDAKLRVDDVDEKTKIECPKCGDMFRPRDGRLDDDADDRPAKKKVSRRDADEDDRPAKKKSRAGGRDDDDDDDRPTKKSKKPAKSGGKLSPGAMLAIGGGSVLVVVVAIVLVLVVVLSNDPSKKPVANDGKIYYPDGTVGVNPRGGNTNGFVPNGNGGNPFNPPPNGNPFQPQNGPDENPGPFQGPGPFRGPGVRPGPLQPNELDDLFRKAVNVQPPSIRAGILRPADENLQLDVPTFFSLRQARQTKPANPPATPPKVVKGALTLEEAKAATVFVKVDAGDQSGSGSGFYLGSENGVALIGTNHHVIEAAAGRHTGTGPAPKISCIFQSGVPGAEHESSARILAIDPISDLAVLRLDNPPARLPKPIDPWATPPLSEATDIRILGFPFGAQLAVGSKNPNITVNNGSISSLRLNAAGTLEQVQINGSLNPGNSGGPIVDKDGRLIGIAVATITGSGIGFAVPVNNLIALLEGRLLITAFVPEGVQGNTAKFKVVIPIMDPRGQVRTAYVRYWAGNGPKPKGVKDPKIGWKPIERAEQVNLVVPDTPSSLAVVAGELTLPTSADEVVIQIASESVSGLVAASAPVTYKLKVESLPNASDARPVGDIVNQAEQLNGQTVVVRAKILGASTSRAAVQDVLVGDAKGRLLTGVRFVTDRTIAAQMDEVDKEHQGLDARLTCLIGQRVGNGPVPIRIARIDLLEESGEGFVRTVPSADTKDQLASLNRDPKKFSGQNMTLSAFAILKPIKLGDSDELIVVFNSLRPPRNLRFVAQKSLSERLEKEKMKMNRAYKVRLTTSVGRSDDDSPTKVTVSKIEVLDPRDENNVLLVLE